MNGATDQEHATNREFLFDGLVNSCKPFGQKLWHLKISGNAKCGKLYVVLVTKVGDRYGSEYLNVFSYKKNATCNFNECEFLQSEKYYDRVWYKYVCPSWADVFIQKLPFVAAESLGYLCEIAVMSKDADNAAKP